MYILYSVALYPHVSCLNHVESQVFQGRQITELPHPSQLEITSQQDSDGMNILRLCGKYKYIFWIFHGI